MKVTKKSTHRRQGHRRPISVLNRSLEQSHLIKFQRMLLKHSSSPNKMYMDSLLLDYPNPALDPHRIEFLDERFEVDYLLHNLYRKLVIPGVTPKEKLRKAAFKAFFDGERKNIRTNRRLSSISFHDEEVNTFVWRVQSLISYILGAYHPDKIAEFSRFSSGATADLPLRKATLQEKYDFRNPSSTLPAARRFLKYVLKEDDEATGAVDCHLVAGNRLLTVPKSNSTDRTIAAEPTLNMYFQLGVGRHIRSRLRRFGVNLNDQTINQELARQGSIDGSLATIDLENASNSVSYEVVRLLLPKEWFEVLSDLRSPYGTIEGRLHRYRMFSSMGNGYTFELESLLFYAICKVACPRGSVISVYGDDIIVPSAHATEVIRWLRFFGFDTNLSKSFTTGRFRESCGKHFHSGADVSPFFVRRIPRGTDIFLMFNNLARWSTRYGLDIRYVDALEYVLSFVPDDSLFIGPDGYGDGHLLEVEGVTPKTTFKFSRKGCALTFKALALSFDKEDACQSGALCASLLGHTKENTMSMVHDSVRKRWRLINIRVQS